MARLPWTLLLACCALLPLVAGESGRRRASPGRSQVFRLGALGPVGCVVLTEEEADRIEANGDGSSLTDRISAARRRASQRGTTRAPSPQRGQQCPSGVTFFDGCNSCSCGTDQLCTLKACNDDTMVHIYDPCQGINCGYHQRCQPICVGQVCTLRPLCVSDDFPTCHNCPWLCVDERLDCTDNFNGSCKPSLACYKPNV